MCLLNSAVQSFFHKNKCFSHLKTVIVRKESSDIYTQFSKWNITEDTQASNLDGFIIGVTCFS
jgi:hypothetical protein